MAIGKKMESKVKEAPKKEEPTKEKQKPICYIKAGKKLIDGEASQNSYSGDTRKEKNGYESGLVSGLFLRVDAPNEHIPNGNVSLSTSLLNDLQLEKGTNIEIPLWQICQALGIKLIVNADKEVAVEAADEE